MVIVRLTVIVYVPICENKVGCAVTESDVTVIALVSGEMVAS
jgi:hypothetical protein